MALTWSQLSRTLRSVPFSLSRGFAVLALAVFLGIGAVSLWFTWKLYEHEELLVKSRIDVQTKRLEHSYRNLVVFTTRQMEQISNKVRDVPKQNVQEISNILSTFKTQADKNLLWSTFLWTDENHIVQATNDIGVLMVKRDLSERDYIPKTVQHPNTLHLGKPVFGIVSGRWAIPGGYGVLDKKGHYLGSVVTGLVVDQLIYHLGQSVSIDGITYALLDHNNRIMASSDGFESSVIEHGLDGRYAKVISTEDGNAIAFDADFVSKSLQYNGEKDVTAQPSLKLVVSYDWALSHRSILSTIALRVFELLSIGLVLLIIVLVIKRRLVQPIIMLSDAAERISNGEEYVSVPRSKVREINVLAHQLINIQRKINHIKRIDRQLLYAKQQAEQASKAKSEFLGSMSHELRTPLNAIIGYSEMLQKQVFGQIPNKKYLEYADDINSSGTHLLSLIEDILDIARMESNLFKINVGHVDMIRIYELVSVSLDDECHKKNIGVVTHFDKNLPHLYVDERRMKQVLFNLMSNAIKFSFPNSEIMVTMRQTNEGFILTVKDHGIGLLEKNVSSVFEKFTQIDSSITRQEEGLGLGLWLAKKCVESHEGLIEICSVVNEWTEVKVVFPAKRIISNDATEQDTEQDTEQEYERQVE